ncbi:PTS lactose transporter subunit IIBC [Sharpea azabuensis]|uniref:PTS system lactose-specific EIICB component n=1 Tax=Sharpea azabuensis TaxID=322505 RepID=A0A1H6QNZ1_9FIRM|nr:PTS lactose transporter subunit IIBC [Sharpea azabuensis]HAJ15053.1 PTS lactose transporter subunit IIBC [Erysipelotrichaceae bacterium]MEE3307573.1 PTS lactose transporter subunit IIBC [Sharpea azabuensis]SEI43726.1 PTS system lactose-specific IIB component, Lac family /PTS system lactose-specific IIC component, Lac family [Sharpea azabuensis]HAV19200.1 PTS lactose transporter subunit IIBC [Erysipelotrichaceae bacterium]HBZ51721.1 PTS lactose transporter subunit IIBC [Erysipelotrichaceae b
MDTLIAKIESAKPFFDRVSRNKYLKSIRDGFMSAMPVILFSSIFLLIAFVPNIFGFYWPKDVENAIMKPYNYSMGILALLVAGSTAKNLTDNMNRELPVNLQINNISTFMAGIVGTLVMAVDPIKNGLAIEYMGSKGLLTGFLVAFLVCNIYRYCVKRNITIHMPSEVPPNISQTFADIIPFAFSILLLAGFDLIFRKVVGMSFAAGVIAFFKPIFLAADGYLGLALVYGSISLFWFVGIHGPSIVEPAVSAIYYMNIAANLDLFRAGGHATNILTPGVQQFVCTMGGTGATLVVTLMFAFMARSKELKAVGRASAIPVLFGVNEPILFGAPLILNPVFFIPFVLAPIMNVWLFKIFVDVLGMNSFMYILPWTTPAPIGIVLGCGLGLLCVIYVLCALLLDFLIYYPFFRVYDGLKVQEEDEASDVQNEEEALEVNNEVVDQKRILVLCAGGGTSGLLAHALDEGAKEKGIKLTTAAGAYGAHYDMLKNFDLVILAPQVANNLEDLKKDTDRLHIKCTACQSKQYIGLTRDPQKALEFVFSILNDDGGNV